MNPGSSERLDRIEQVLEATAARQQYLTELLAQTAERQSTSAHQIEQVNQSIGRLERSVGRLERAVEIDAENIRRLANIAASHDARLDSHESRLDTIEGGETA